MSEPIKNFLRRRRIGKCSRAVPTGLLPLSEISVINVVIDVEELGYDELKESILAWGRSMDKKVNIYFFDFRKLGKNELMLTSIQTTISRKELSWIGTPPYEKVAPLIEDPSDLFISLINNADFPIDFLAKCSSARFKIGRKAYTGHCYDMVFSDRQSDGLRYGGGKVFAGIVEFLEKISK